MNTPDKELSVVIPAYREAEALDLLLPRLMDALPALTGSFEILVVDSMEPLDDTLLVCAKHAVRHVRRTGGNFYGDAVRTGIREAQGRRVLLMDADGSHNPAHITALWERRDGCEVVIGSRYVAGGRTENPFVLILLSYVVNLVFRLTFRLNVKDVSNSFRLYDGDALRSLSLVSNNFDIVEEILIKLNRKLGPRRIVEVPITFEKRKRGESKRSLVAFAFSYLYTLYRLSRLA